MSMQHNRMAFQLGYQIQSRADVGYFSVRVDAEHLALGSGYGERVERSADVPAALARALHAVRVEGRQALLNVIGA